MGRWVIRLSVRYGPSKIPPPLTILLHIPHRPSRIRRIMFVWGPIWMNDWMTADCEQKTRLAHLPNQPRDQRVCCNSQTFIPGHWSRDDVPAYESAWNWDWYFHKNMMIYQHGSNQMEEDILGCGSGLQSAHCVQIGCICVFEAKRKQSAWFAQYYSHRAYIEDVWFRWGPG